MAAISNPGTNATEFSGEYKLVSMYNLAMASASEAIVLSFAENGISEIQNAIVCINTSLTDGDGFIEVACSFSDLTVTITAVEEGGGAADEFTTTTVNLLVVGK